jgi:GAF domain-containing protein
MSTVQGERIAEEQAALRRVATLIARAAPPDEVFAAISAEVGGVVPADLTTLSRYHPDGAGTVVGTWSKSGAALPVPLGLRLEYGGRNLHTVVFLAGRPVRIDDYADAWGPVADVARERGIRSSVGAPISVEGRLWGVMCAMSTDGKQLPADTETRLVGFTELVGTAIANAQARMELHNHAEEQTALWRVATLVASGASPELVFAVVAEEVGRLLGVDFTILSRCEPDDAQVSVGAWSNTEADVPFPVGTRVRLGGRNVVSLVVRTGRPARIDDYADASGMVADAARAGRLCSAVGVPISVEGRLWGVMAVGSGQKRPMPANAEERLAAFTELVGTAIANAQARVELRGFAEEQAALRRVATLVARAASPDEVFAAVTAEVGRALSADFTTMSRYDAGGMTTIVGEWTSTGVAAPVGIGSRLSLGGRNATTLVFDTGRPVGIDYSADSSGPIADAAREWGFSSAVGVPIDVEGRLWGIVTVASARERSLPANTEARLVAFTELVGTAIANAQARVELRGFAEEQAALRRVATLVARAAPPGEVFAAVTAEAGRLLSAHTNALMRFDPDGMETVLGSWTRPGVDPVSAVGTRLQLGGRNVSTLVFQTGEPARLDDYADSSGAIGDWSHELRLRGSVGVPVSVGGRLWGVMIVSSRSDPIPVDTEARLAGFSELVATAVANAEARAALTASRARIVAAADQARRRIERDLHDGAQQRLVSLALHLRGKVHASPPPETGELTAQMDLVADGLTEVLDELREIARGLHPTALAEGGLRPALTTLARRSAVPVRLDIGVDERLPEPIELAAYYVVSEALTNTVKHAQATVIDVRAAAGDGVLRVDVRDDGHGGADPTGGSGLVGLTDRVEALGGRLTFTSPPGDGTALRVVLPLPADRGRPPKPPARGEPSNPSNPARDEEVDVGEHEEELP